MVVKGYVDTKQDKDYGRVLLGRTDLSVVFEMLFREIMVVPV